MDADSDWARAKAAARASTPAQPKKPKPSPPKAAAVKKAATTRRSGDVAISSSARALLDEIKGCANNVKEFQYEEKKRTTAGARRPVHGLGLRPLRRRALTRPLLCTIGCRNTAPMCSGLPYPHAGMRELYGSESLTQVMLFLIEMFVVSKVPPPRRCSPMTTGACRISASASIWAPPLHPPAPLLPGATSSSLRRTAPPRSPSLPSGSCSP